MQRLGFIHDMMDIKVLILFVTARANYPMTRQEIYEVCYQDDCVSYFDICTAIPQLVTSGHLQELPEERYVITEKGKTDGGVTEDSIAFTVKRRAAQAIDRFNRQIRRSSYVKTQILPRENGDFSVVMSLDNEVGNLMTLEMLAPDRYQAIQLSKRLEKKAETVYNLVLTELLDNEEEEE